MGVPPRVSVRDRELGKKFARGKPRKWAAGWTEKRGESFAFSFNKYVDEIRRLRHYYPDISQKRLGELEADVRAGRVTFQMVPGVDVGGERFIEYNEMAQTGVKARVQTAYDNTGNRRINIQYTADALDNSGNVKLEHQFDIWHEFTHRLMPRGLPLDAEEITVNWITQQAGREFVTRNKIPNGLQTLARWSNKTVYKPEYMARLCPELTGKHTKVKEKFYAQVEKNLRKSIVLEHYWERMVPVLDKIAARETLAEEDHKILAKIPEEIKQRAKEIGDTQFTKFIKPRVIKLTHKEIEDPLLIPVAHLKEQYGTFEKAAIGLLGKVESRVTPGLVNKMATHEKVEKQLRRSMQILGRFARAKKDYEGRVAARREGVRRPWALKPEGIFEKAIGIKRKEKRPDHLPI